MAWLPGIEQEGTGGGLGGGYSIMRVTYKAFKGTNLTVVEGMHQFIMHIL